MKKDPGHLTASDFYKFTKCPNWLYWDIFGDEKDKKDIPEMMQRLQEQGVAHEKEVVEEMFGECEEVEYEEDVEEQFKETLEAMKRGETIYQGTLMDGDWVGRPDLLIPKEEPSELGDYTYEAVDIKSANHLNDVHRYQLVFYALLLEKIQGTMPETGKIINAKKKTLEFPIRDVYSDFFDILNKILDIRAGNQPPLYLASSCKESPWFDLLKEKVKEADDISQIYKLYRKEYHKLRDAGYETLQQIAEEDFETLDQSVTGISRQRLQRLQLQAISLRKNETIRIGEPELPDDEVEIHFDIEGDPFDQIEYLFGVLIRKNGKEEYKAFIAEKPEDEEKNWTAFCDFIEDYAGTPIYHYGWYELDVIRRLSAEYGISREAADALDHSNMIDLNRILQYTVIFPLYFYSLKDVCRHLGFEWRADDASGANSVMWYHDWHNNGDKSLRQKIIDYNEDDVRATAFLKDWLIKK